MVAPTELTLITGVSGFLGSATALAFLENNQHIRATVRSQAKADAWAAKYPQYQHLIEWVVIPDIGVEVNAFKQAVKGCTRVVHTASPFHAVVSKASEFLDPAVRGTVSVLEAAMTEPSIKSVVITSSDAAVRDHAKGWRPGYCYTSADWNPSTEEEALAETDWHSIYVASKLLAERAAWAFMESHSPSFTLAVILPVVILGPMLQPVASLADINFSTTLLWNLVDAPAVPDSFVPMFVDVRDCAKAHYEATFRPIAAGKRYLVVSGEYSDALMAQHLRANFPDQAKRVPTGGNPLPPHYTWDSSPAEKELGIKYTSLEDSVKDCATQLFALEKAEKEAKTA